MSGQEKDKAGLLEHLKREAKCLYLSDLHLERFCFDVCKAVEATPEGDYGIREWNEAILYITGNCVEFITSREAKKYLQDFTECKDSVRK